MVCRGRRSSHLCVATAILSYHVVAACDNLITMPDHCYCKGSHLFCDSLMGNWTDSSRLPILRMASFPADVWQLADVMSITGFRYPQGITGKPPFPSNNLRELSIKQSYVPNIGDKPFQYCGSMYKIELVNLGLVTLHPNAFLGLGSLRKLDLSRNNLTVLPEELFQWLGSITDLKLSENRLGQESNIDQLVSGFAQLENLELAVNQLTAVPDLTSCSALVSIDLSYNKIVTLPGVEDRGSGPIGVLSGLDRLENLNLQNNQIQSVSGDFFRDLTSLKSLDLSKNRLTSFQGYYYMRSLTTLNLSYNQISDLRINGSYAMIGANLQSVEQLRLNGNKLVLCDAFFNEIIQMKELRVIDIKSANMPCFCSMENATAIVSQMSLVMDIGGTCLLHRPTSICIGRTDMTYACNANITPLEMKKKCEKQRGSTQGICDSTGYPLAKWHTAESYSHALFLHGILFLFVLL